MRFLRLLSAPVLIVGVSLLVHLPGMTSPLLDYHAYRQCQTASMARNYARHGMHFFHPELDTEGKPRRAGTEFPIYSYLLAILFKGFGTREVLGRFLSSVFAAWGAVFLYLFVRRRLGEARALGSALVMCVLPTHVYFTRTIQPEPVALWGLLGFLYYFDKWLVSGKVRNWLLATLLGALAPLLKLPLLYLIVPLWLYLGWESRGRQTFKPLLFLTSMGGILGLTAAWYHYAHSAPVGVLPLSTKEHWDNLRPLLTFNLWRSHFISRIPELCLTYPGLLFAAAGVRQLYKEGNLRFWGAWFAATALYIVLLGKYGLIHRYTELPFAPINAVFIATGIVGLWEHAHPHSWVRMILTILILGIPLHAGLRIRHWYRWEFPWVFQAGKVIAETTQPGDLVITNTREHPVLLYYIDRYGFAPELEETGLEVLDGYRAQGARFFLTPTQESWARHPEWAAYFAKKARLIHQDRDYLLYRF